MSSVDAFRRQADQILLKTAKTDIAAQEMVLARHERDGASEAAAEVRARIAELRGEIEKLEQKLEGRG